jgi:hypothetical protein
MATVKISADDLLKYAEALVGETLHTLHQGKKFRLEVSKEEITYFSGEKPYRCGKEKLSEICGKFGEIFSLNPGNYGTGVKESCTLAVIVKFLGMRVDGK